MPWWRYLWAPGLATSGQVELALVVGTTVAVVSAVVGFFVVVRAQAFLGHALSDMGATGAAGAALVGVQALWGFLAGGLAAGLTVEAGSERAHDRDLATGVTLSFTLGLSALFLQLITQDTSHAGVTQAILFGSIFTVAPSIEPAMIALGLAAIALVAVLFRPLLFASLTPETARARGVPVRLVGILFLLAVVTAVEQSALVVGALLSTALLVGPAAAASRLTDRPGAAIAVAVVIAVGAVWLGVGLAYDSYLWPPAGRGWPVSFLVTAVVFLVYVATRLGRRAPTGGADPTEAV